MRRRPPPRIVVTAVVVVRRALLRLADRIVPAHLALFDRSIGVGRTHVIGTLADLGVADLLAERPAGAADLAARLEVDVDALHRVLRAAAVEGLVRMDRRGRFSLTRLGRPLCAQTPHSIRDWTRYVSLRSTTSAWADLTATVRSGKSAFRRVHDTSVWEWFAAHPEEERLFAGAMRRLTEEDAPAIVAGYPWPERGTVCDLAGGVGTLLAAILRARPGLEGLLVDGPGVLEQADAWLTTSGLRDRVTLAPGDLFGRIEATADVYLMKDVLHDWDGPACAQMLGAVRRAMPAGARLVLVETLQERNRPHWLASLADIQMLTQCEQGRQRSADELADLLRGAGLRPGAVRRTSGPALVEGFAE